MNLTPTHKLCGGKHIYKNLKPCTEAEYRFCTKKNFTGLYKKPKTASTIMNYGLTNKNSIIFKVILYRWRTKEKSSAFYQTA